MIGGTTSEVVLGMVYTWVQRELSRQPWALSPLAVGVSVLHKDPSPVVGGREKS